jgi:hypothetical protein
MTAHISPNSVTASATARADPLKVFIARAEARAILWAACEFDLHQVVDELQAAAGRSGLVVELGQDEVQAIMAQAFGAVRDDISDAEDQDFSQDEERPEISDCWLADSFRDACLKADAEHLARVGDAGRIRAWMAERSPRERVQIRECLRRMA